MTNYVTEQMIILARQANVEWLGPIGALPFAAFDEQPVAVGSVRHLSDGSDVLVVAVGIYETEHHDSLYTFQSYQEYDAVPCSTPGIKVRSLMDHPETAQVVWVD